MSDDTTGTAAEDATGTTAEDATGTTTVRSVLVGTHGFERATVWGAVGFSLAYAAFAFVPATAGDASIGFVPAWFAPSWFAVVCVAVGAIGAVALARGGTGVLPCTVLVYGPVAAALLRTIDPLYAAVLPAAAVVEPLAIALAAAVAVGPASYVVGRLLAPSSDRRSTPAAAASDDAVGDD